MESWFECELRIELRFPDKVLYSFHDAMEGSDFWKVFTDRVLMIFFGIRGVYAIGRSEKEKYELSEDDDKPSLVVSKTPFRLADTGDRTETKTQCREICRQTAGFLAPLFPVLEKDSIHASLTCFRVCREQCFQTSAGVPEEYLREQ
ncbi:MAG: hypothetical protein LBQ54_05610 [Planctomycetaceae bacterium]|jgi:hypothetical protein|nr:hypothetical protein [Planctomycetaceae bacterium]